MPGVTPIYNLPYQTTSDPPNGPALGSNLATAVEAQIQRLDGLIAALGLLTEVTTGFTPAAGFSLSSFRAFKINRVCTVQLYVSVTTAINLDGSGNLPDKTIGSLPSGWYPNPTKDPAMFYGDNGLYVVTGVINLDGTMTARAASGSIAAGSNLRIMSTFIRDTA